MRRSTSIEMNLFLTFAFLSVSCYAAPDVVYVDPSTGDVYEPVSADEAPRYKREVYLIDDDDDNDDEDARKKRDVGFLPYNEDDDVRVAYDSDDDYKRRRKRDIEEDEDEDDDDIIDIRKREIYDGYLADDLERRRKREVVDDDVDELYRRKRDVPYDTDEDSDSDEQ